MQPFSLTFGTPEHGWLDVRLSGDGGDVHHDASDVPGDSIAMLADAACSVLDGAPEARVIWFLEPAEVTWTLTRDGGDLASIWVQDEHGPAQSIVHCEVRAMCQVIWRALRRLETNPVVVADLERHAWSNPVGPATRRLGERL